MLRVGYKRKSDEEERVQERNKREPKRKGASEKE